MLRAVQLAWRGAGLTRPNPPVGAVVVKDGRKVGEGYHRKAGGPHAEVLALRRAGRDARGATLYVTMEPCSTWGRTPPCTDAILSCGVRRVVAAARDPNPKHRGRGLARLRRQGIRVSEGVCAAEGLELARGFSKWVTTGRPYVTLKMAMTLDGKIADARGNSRWISGAASRAVVQELRRRSDAILVGAGTVRSDDPSLLPRPARGRMPFRVVVSSRGGIPPGARMLRDDGRARTIVAVSTRCPKARVVRLARAGVRVWVLGGRRGRVRLAEVLGRLGREGCLQVLCEGGSELAGELVRDHLVDEYVFFVAPRLVGGRRAPGAVGGMGLTLDSSRLVRVVECRHVGSDLMVKAVRR